MNGGGNQLGLGDGAVQNLNLFSDAHAQELGTERAGFLSWLEGAIGAPIKTLQGQTQVRSYEDLTLDELLALLRRNRARLRQSPDSRAFRDLLEGELGSSVERLSGHQIALDQASRHADHMVYDLYELSGDHRALIDTEYGG